MESNLKSPPLLKTELLFTHISHYGSISKGTGRNIYILVCVHESQEAEGTQMPITEKQHFQRGNVIYNQELKIQTQSGPLPAFLNATLVKYIQANTI